VGTGQDIGSRATSAVGNSQPVGVAPSAKGQRCTHLHVVEEHHVRARCSSAGGGGDIVGGTGGVRHHGPIGHGQRGHVDGVLAVITCHDGEGGLWRGVFAVVTTSAVFTHIHVIAACRNGAYDGRASGCVHHGAVDP